VKISPTTPITIDLFRQANVDRTWIPTDHCDICKEEIGYRKVEESLFFEGCSHCSLGGTPRQSRWEDLMAWYRYQQTSGGRKNVLHLLNIVVTGDPV